jgi:ABC-2 type transport system permease protein
MRSYTQQISFSSAEPDTMLNYFYALIAMTCLYGGFWGLRNTTDVQADLSPQGARRSVAPTHKLGVVLCDAAAALTISLAEVAVLLAYLAVVLRVSFGNQVSYVLLTCLAGCIAGVSLGAFIGTFVRRSEDAKTAIMIGSSLTMSFLAGLMMVNMKDIIARKAPFLSYINPAALITDAFYSLYVFDNHRRFFLNIGLLLLISSAMCILSFLRLRGERYASL